MTCRMTVAEGEVTELEDSPPVNLTMLVRAAVDVVQVLGVLENGIKVEEGTGRGLVGDGGHVWWWQAESIDYGVGLFADGNFKMISIGWGVSSGKTV